MLVGLDSPVVMTQAEFAGLQRMGLMTDLVNGAVYRANSEETHASGHCYVCTINGLHTQLRMTRVVLT